MSLLELEHVGKSYSRGSHVALDDLSLAIDPGEMVVVWGERQSGRSTLLRIAAGVETPSEGVVRFDGRDLAAAGRGDARRRDQLLPSGVPALQGTHGPRPADGEPIRAQGPAIHRADPRLEGVGARRRRRVRPADRQPS